MEQFAHWRINLVTSGCFNGIITIDTVDALVSWQNYRLLPLLRSLFGEEEPPICTPCCYCSTTRYRFFVWGPKFSFPKREQYSTTALVDCSLFPCLDLKVGMAIENNVKINTFLIVHIISRSKWQSSPSETTTPSAGDLWVWLTGRVQASGGK